VVKLLPALAVIALALLALLFEEWKAAGALTMLACIYLAALRRAKAVSDGKVPVLRAPKE
jgi:hypothetical protein